MLHLFILQLNIHLYLLFSSSLMSITTTNKQIISKNSNNNNIIKYFKTVQDHITIKILFSSHIFMFLLIYNSYNLDSLNKIKGENYYLHTTSTTPKNETISPWKILQISTNEEERSNTISEYFQGETTLNSIDLGLDDWGTFRED